MEIIEILKENNENQNPNVIQLNLQVMNYILSLLLKSVYPLIFSYFLQNIFKKIKLRESIL